MNFDIFIRTCNTEKRAIRLWKNFRDKQGVFCSRCGSNDHYWLPSKLRYRCKKCGVETTLRSGTFMEYSKLPFRFWMHGIGVLAFQEKPSPALQIQQKLRHPNYRPIWFMMKRLRELKANRAEWLVMLDHLTAEIAECGLKAPKRKQKTQHRSNSRKQVLKQSQA